MFVIFKRIIVMIWCHYSTSILFKSLFKKKTPPFLAVADLLVQVFGFLCVRCFLFTWLGRFLSLWTSLVENMEEMYWIFKRKIILFVFCSFIGERKQTKFCWVFLMIWWKPCSGLLRIIQIIKLCVFICSHHAVAAAFAGVVSPADKHTQTWAAVIS